MCVLGRSGGRRGAGRKTVYNRLAIPIFCTLLLSFSSAGTFIIALFELEHENEGFSQIPASLSFLLSFSCRTGSLTRTTHQPQPVFSPAIPGLPSHDTHSRNTGVSRNAKVFKGSMGQCHTPLE